MSSIIRFALKQRVLVVALACVVLALGVRQSLSMRIDVFPDLNRPRVVIMTEAPGLAPEEVESMITFPIETAVNGASGVQAVRSSSGVGISVIYVEFDWGTDINVDRQIVNERLQLVQTQMPQGVTPTLAPISSIMGQILILGIWRDAPADPAPSSIQSPDMETRTLADWVIRQRLLTIPGVSQVFAMGGGRKQYQVLVDPDALLQFGVTLHDIRQAVADSNANATGGYLDEQGPNELLVRVLGRVESLEDLRKIVVKSGPDRSVYLSQVATIIEGAQVKRGDSAAFVRENSGAFSGGPAVVLTVNKQPGADTRRVTRDVLDAIDELAPSLPSELRIEPLYTQASFIDRAIENVLIALRDGAFLVVVILFLFLINLRATFVTLTAIPLSIAVTALVFAWFGLSVNTMTLGGLAVAIGELVDDAIVDVENIFRRLKENRLSENPLSPLRVVYLASLEVRSSIVCGTAIVILVFLPLFGLTGLVGRLFVPLGLAYAVSILSSLLISLTVTPVLAYWLLGNRHTAKDSDDGVLLRVLKGIGERVIRFSLRVPLLNLLAVMLLVGVSSIFLLALERDFLPPFSEGSVQLNVLLPPGTSLATSNQVARSVEQRLQQIDDVSRFVRRTGRAELDEHAEGVNVSEFILEMDPNSPRSRAEQLTELRVAMKDIPGVVTAVEQPLAHLISHMLSGVKAQIGIKLYGDDLDQLRMRAGELESVIRSVDGVTDLIVEPQVTIPQLRIKLDRDQLQLHGLSSLEVNEFIETAMNGVVVSDVFEGQKKFDLLVRLDESVREDIETIRRLTLERDDGGRLPLEAVARIYESGGPNTINRENVKRRIVLQCNVENRGVVDVVKDIQDRVREKVEDLPPGYFLQYSGQFASQQSASRTIGLLFGVALLGVFFVLYAKFRSFNLALQVLAALPMAFIGSVAALVVTGQLLTVPALVGFISLAGIASRNGILLISHYLRLVAHEGQRWNQDMIVRAGRERLAPVLMTALTSGIGLIPLVLAADETGKEILYPVATVILGGLISSTLLDFLVHPALFWKFGIESAQRVVERSTAEWEPEGVE